jgi:hypothetical protein
MRQQDELFSQLYRVNGSEVTILPTLKHELLVATLKNFKIIRKLFFITEESGAAGKIRAWLRKDFGVHDLLLSDSLSISLQSGHLNGTEGKRPWRLIKLEEHLPNLLSLVLFELPVEQSVPDLMISDRIKRRFKITLLPRFEHFYEECLSADNANTIFPKTSKKWMFSTSTLVAVTFDAMVKVRRARDFILIYQKNDSAVLYFAADGGEYDVLCQLRIQGNSLFSRLWWTPYTVPVRRSERNLKDFVRFIIQEDLKAVDKSRLFERACKICKSKTVDCFSSENLYCLLKYADYFFFISNRESSGAGIKNDATSGVQIGVHIYEHHLKQSLAAIHDVGITISRPDQHADSERNLQFLLGEHGVSSYPIGCVYFKLNCDGSLILTTLSTLGCEQLPTDNLPLKETICIFRISPETLKRSQFSIKVKRENFRNGEYSLRAFADSSTNIADSLVAKILLEHRRALLKSKYSELLMGDHVDQSIESLVLSVSSFTDFTVDVFDLVMSAEKAIHGNAAEILDKTFQNMTKVSEKYFSRVSCRSNLFYFPKSCGGNIKEISSCPIFMAREFIFWPSEAVAGSADDFSDFHKLMRFSRLKGSDGLQERLKLRLRVYYLPFLDQTRSSQLDRDRNTPISEAVNLIENEIREGAVKLLLFAEPCIPYHWR